MCPKIHTFIILNDIETLLVILIKNKVQLLNSTYVATNVQQTTVMKYLVFFNTQSCLTLNTHS